MSKQKFEKIKSFDREFREAGEYPSFFPRFVAYLVEFCIIPVLTIMIVERNVDGVSLSEVIVVLLYSCFFSFHLCNYINCNEGDGAEAKEKVNVYTLLQFMPVSTWDIFKVRLYYLLKLLYKRVILMWVLQVPFCWYRQSVTLENILYPLILYFIVFLVSVIYIYPKR